MFSSSKHPHDEVALVLDISSGYVEGAIVQFAEAKPPHILYTAKISIPFMEEKNSLRLKTELFKALDETVAKVQREGLPHLKFTALGRHSIRTVYCILSSPWYISQTKIVKIEKEKQISVTPSFLETLVSEEKKAFEKEIKEGRYSENFKDEV